MPELGRDEQKSILIQNYSGHEKEQEIIFMLALHTAYTMPPEVGIRLGYLEYDTEELTDRITAGLDGNTFDDEEKAMDAVLCSIGFDKAVYIIENIDAVLKKYQDLISPIKEIKYNTLKLFVAECAT